ncbi:type II secretion system protein M [Pusillimonas sp. CC-YST705]|uniref:Type II secretion system protein M n=1 Tax=Mesopusillimonas faecipullorum TaxID=2755040 RepID=A0ABS8CEC2_9BURK|nr:type II secretion system protein GspM [Mesopusillimonas faecipullorum]MCB5364383.1 type II secretion system protein M [Mesopusillimonas faecipullorum]
MSSWKTPALSPALQARLDDTRQRARAFWLQRTLRERRLLTVAAVLVGIWLLWAVAVQPALRTVEDSRKSLPALRADAAQVQALIIEAQALQRGRAVVQDADAVQAALEASLQRAGLAQASVTRLSETGADTAALWSIQLEQASATRVVDWLASLAFLLQLETRKVDLARYQVDGRDRAGLLSGTVELALPAQEGK